MGDSENAHQPSKKRGALKQLSRENPDDDDGIDSAGLEGGTFKKASDEVLATRRIVKIKRKEPSSSAAPAAASNPFAGIQLLPTTAPLAESKVAPAEAVVEDNQKEVDTEDGDEVESNKKVVDVKEEESEKTKDKDDDNQCGKTSDDKVSDAGVDQTTVEGADQTEDKESGGDETESKEKEGEGDKNGDNNNSNNNNGSLSSFQQHSSSKNAFTGLASTQASGSSFSFGVVSQDGSTGGSGSLFGFGISNSNSPSLFGASGSSSIIKKSEGTGFPSKQEVSTETGEENEEVAFSADSIMFEYLDGGWRERGKGEVKVNVSSNGGKARLVMRAKGNYRLILNASLYPEMKLASMDKKGITFACVNSEGKEGLSTFALKFKDPTIVEEFLVAVDKHKDWKQVEETASPPLKTPENSPTATDSV